MTNSGFRMSVRYTFVFLLVFIWMTSCVSSRHREPAEGQHTRHPENVQYRTVPEVKSDDSVGGDGSGEGEGVIGLPIVPTPSTTSNKHNGEDEDDLDKQGDVVDKFLSIVEEYERNKDTCVPGTEFNLGEGVVAQYGVQRFKNQAIVSVNQANFLTRIWKSSPKALLDSEYFLYTNVRSMVEGDPDLFAAGNCYDFFEYKEYKLFCPFAYRLPNGTIMVKDLSVEYYYLGNSSEFFYQARLNAARKLMGNYNETVGLAMYRFNQSAHREPAIQEDSIKIEYEDGHWGKPYFDCGGGDIWMMTYTVPFFGYEGGNYFFKGTSGIDIDLQKVDIDQCALPPGSTALNVFEGSDKCKPETTECVPIHGLGFRRGSYKCQCRSGFYYPDFSIPLEKRFYNGSIIETEYERMAKGMINQYAQDNSFKCKPCAPGCETCTDSSPCILSLNWLQRSVVLGVSCLIMGFIPILIWFTYRYRDVKVLKAASPMLLRIILMGAFLLYCPLIVQYFHPTAAGCSIRMWLREIGFSISYGALLLKTWRISVVFRVRSARAIKISDTDLIKRLVIIVLIFAVYLSIRMVIARPRVVKGTHSSGLHAFQCSWDIWDYCAAIAELGLLLWGVRLCIVVRKAPSEFNESQFISWAIYNETLLSLFLNITMFFLQSPANPDLLYLVLFIHTQLTTTVTLGFLFGSKAYLVYKYRGKEQPPTTINRGSKYVAAPKSATTLLTTVNTSGNTAYTNPAGCGNEALVNGTEEQENSLEKDIQEEFKRLYTQLEVLKQKNMKLGNPHLTYKLSAMTEAAMIDEPSYTTSLIVPTNDTPINSTPIHSTPNVNGKRVIINLDDYKDATSL